MFGHIRHLIRRTRSILRERHKAKTRSPHWRAVEHAQIELHSTCAGCRSTKHLQVHHRKPFHLHPELELDPGNLITLCMDTPECHLRIGHGDNFQAFNPEVDRDSAEALENPSKREMIWARAKAARLLTGGD